MGICESFKNGNNTNVNNNENILQENYQKNENITFFFHSTIGKSYQITEEKNKNFKSVLDQFILEKFPSDDKISVNVALFNAQKIDFNKSLSENGITSQSHVLLYMENIN